jgi:AcrR family transcriptional regulator
MVKGPTKRQLQAAESKKKIRDSAIRLWQEDDYEKITIERLCGAAGVSAGLFYNYYVSKEDVLRGDYARFGELIDRAVKTLSFASALDAIRTIVYIYAYYSTMIGYKIVTQWFRMHLSISNRLANESDMLNRHVKNMVIQALKAGELNGTWTGKSAVRLLLCHIRSTVFDWVMRKGCYDLVKRMAEDLESTLYLLKQDVKISVNRKLLAGAREFFTAALKDVEAGSTVPSVTGPPRE